MNRMKKVATAMFALALAGALATWPYRAGFGGGLLFAACEAALVGALADWFAVVALFRHPLGLKFIPHTAIIPNNRDRIIEGIISIVETEWLSLDFIKAKIYDYKIIDGLAEALDTDRGRRELERLAEALLKNALKEINPSDVAHFVQNGIKDNLSGIRISPELVKHLEDSIKNLYGDQLIQLMLDWAIGATRGDEFERAVKRTISRTADDYSNQGNFLRRLSKGLGESLDILNYDQAARALSHRINRMLIEMQAPENRYHIKVKSELQKLKMADAEAASLILNSMLKNIAESEIGFEAITEIFTILKNQLLGGDEQDMPLIHYLADMAIKQIKLIRQDEERKTVLENRIKDELANLLVRYHGVIGQIVKEKLESLDNEGLVISLEAKVGNDLQWIRINGTVIGALVGIMQYLILHLI
ncbi:MAG: DUF445 domain-containing protein [Syntrophomonadaceae bacterium]